MLCCVYYKYKMIPVLCYFCCAFHLPIIRENLTGKELQLLGTSTLHDVLLKHVRSEMVYFTEVENVDICSMAHLLLTCKGCGAF